MIDRGLTAINKSSTLIRGLCISQLLQCARGGLQIAKPDDLGTTTPSCPAILIAVLP